MTSIYFIYIIQCRGGRLYTGITTDIKRRFAEHSGGVKGAKFTRANPPEKLLAVWSCEGRSAAAKLECAVKKLDRPQKLALISDNDFFTKKFGTGYAVKYKRENVQFC